MILVGRTFLEASNHHNQALRLSQSWIHHYSSCIYQLCKKSFLLDFSIKDLKIKMVRVMKTYLKIKMVRVTKTYLKNFHMLAIMNEGLNSYSNAINMLNIFLSYKT